MRKSVFFLLTIIYVVSILVVTFFGIQIEIGQYQTYIESVTITNEHEIREIGGEKIKFIRKEYDDNNLLENYIQLEYAITPVNDKVRIDKVKYYISSGDETYTDEDGKEQHLMNVTDFGKVSCFLPKYTLLASGEKIERNYCAFEVTIKTTDGSDKMDSVSISFYRKRD